MGSNTERSLSVNVLISCMHQKDTSIIERTGIQTDVIVVNQCDKDCVEDFEFQNRKGELCHCKFINTTERGLSRSRNMAIKNAWGDICLICDDDELFVDNYEDIIQNAYLSNVKASVITFAFNRKGKKYPPNGQKLNIMRIIKTSSVEITFKRDDIISAGICFDVMMGSGSGNGAGEENKFLMDCHRKGLEMRYEPAIIAALLSTDSLWFKGRNEKYFRNWGWATRRSMGLFVGGLFVLYALIFNYKKYSKETSFFKAANNMIGGFFEKR